MLSELIHRKYETLFNHFDGNKDGKISPLELRQCICAIGVELSLTEAEAAVGMLSADGFLGFDDFVEFIEGGEEEAKVNDLREAFKMYVMDGSGCITPKSLKKVLSMLGEKTTVDECEGMIAKFDLDGDGMLDFDEFKVMIL